MVGRTGDASPVSPAVATPLRKSNHLTLSLCRLVDAVFPTMQMWYIDK